MSHVSSVGRAVAGLATSTRPVSFVRFSSSALLLALALLVAACGGGGATPKPFAVLPPSGGNGGGGTPGTPLPPPQAQAPTWTVDAITHARTPLYGAFPSDLVRYGNTLFTVDADQVEAAGAWIVPYDIDGDAPVASTTFVPVHIGADDLVDGLGQTANPAQPIGFGFYLNEMEIVGERLGFVLANAGGSDSAPPLSNLLVFDPRTGQVLQTLNLVRGYVTADTILDSSGAVVPGSAFLQSGAEALAYVPTSPTTGKLYVGMANLIVGYPSFGAIKYPGTVQVFDVERTSDPIVTLTDDPTGLATRTLRTGAYNPVSLDVIADTLGVGGPRLLVTLGGTTAYDASFNLVPVTPAAVQVHDGASGAFLGSFELGLTGLVSRPAIGRDGAGHHVGYFPSGVTGEVYALWLDGLFGVTPDLTRLAVLRGPMNGIPVAGPSGSPGGNLAGIGLAPDGDVLVVSGFGDFFTNRPGRLVLASLPYDVVADSRVGTDFTPGLSEFATVAGRTLGAVVLDPNPGTRPDVYVNVSGTLDELGLGASGASVGTLATHGLID